MALQRLALQLGTPSRVLHMANKQIEERKKWPIFVGIEHREVIEGGTYEKPFKAPIEEAVNSVIARYGKGSTLFIEMQEFFIKKAIRGEMSGISNVRAYQKIVRMAHDQGMNVVGLIGKRISKILVKGVLQKKQSGQYEPYPDYMWIADLIVARKGMKLKLRNATEKDLVIVHPEHLKALEISMRIPKNRTQYIGGWIALPNLNEKLVWIRKNRETARKKRKETAEKARKKSISRRILKRG